MLKGLIEEEGEDVAIVEDGEEEVLSPAETMRRAIASTSPEEQARVSRSVQRVQEHLEELTGWTNEDVAAEIRVCKLERMFKSRDDGGEMYRIVLTTTDESRNYLPDLVTCFRALSARVHSGPAPAGALERLLQKALKKQREARGKAA